MIGGAFETAPEAAPAYAAQRARSMRMFDRGLLKGLLTEGRFNFEYKWASVRPPDGRKWIHALFSRKCLANLSAFGYEIHYVPEGT
jgi:hypothetical protein